MAPTGAAYLALFLVAMTVTFLATPLVRRAAVRIGALVAPDQRRVHVEATPTMGGAAMVAGFLAAMALASQMDAFDGVFTASTEAIGVVIGVLLIYAVGVVDDVREISAPAKTAGIVLAGSVLSFAGVSMLFFRIPLLDVLVLSTDLSAVFTVVWVLGMANAVNLIDGLDGLAAGVVGIGAASFFFHALELSNQSLLQPGNIGPMLAVVTAGICVGFLPHNFHPAQIFMGDGGALVLGLLMAASTISVGGRTSQEFNGQTFFFFAPIFIPFFIMGVPIIDTAFAIIRRALNGANLAAPDKGHLHHRLMNLGHGHRRSVLILWFWSALLAFFVLYPTYTGDGSILALVGIIGLGVALAGYTWLHPGASAERARVRVESDSKAQR